MDRFFERFLSNQKIDYLIFDSQLNLIKKSKNVGISSEKLNFEVGENLFDLLPEFLEAKL